MSVFFYAHGIKTVHSWGGSKKRQISVHVIVECPLMDKGKFVIRYSYKHLIFFRFKLTMNIMFWGLVLPEISV